MREEVTRLLAGRKQGHGLPGGLYTSEEVYREELRSVFYEGWIFAGHTCDVASPGDFFTLDIGEESVVVVRDREGEIRAHFNVCRHRGSRVVLEESGSCRALICPYHQWVYGLDGRLINARLMGDGFDREKYRLRSAAVRELAGLVFICLSPDPPDFEPMRRAVEPQLAPHGLDDAKVVRRHSYGVNANWKTIVENNRECYHCQVSHPEFCLSNFDLGVHGDARRDEEYERALATEYERWRSLGLSPEEVSFPDGSSYRVSRLPLKDGFLTESMDGGLVAPLMGDLTDTNTGSLRVITLPNSWAHANCDYAMTTRLLPDGPSRTKVEVSFLVRGDAEEGVDYDPERVAYVWKATCEEDWELCENNYAGIKSLAYEPGPFSPLTEASVESFLDWYGGLLAGSGLETVRRAG